MLSCEFFSYFAIISASSICCDSFLFNFNSVFLKNRIELIAALSNTIFLIIVSMYMCLQALHIVTETDEGENSDYGHDSDEAGTIHFFKNFLVLLWTLKWFYFLFFKTLPVWSYRWKTLSKWKFSLFNWWKFVENFFFSHFILSLLWGWKFYDSFNFTFIYV